MSPPASLQHVTRARYTVHAVSSSPELSESPLWPAAWVHFRLCVLVLAAGFSWTINLMVFDSFGINWQLIFGEEIAGAANLSSAAIARVCGAASLWLWICGALFVQNLGEYTVALQVIDDSTVSETAYVWAKVASASIVGIPLLLLLLPLPVLAWRTRLAWLTLLFKMLAVPFVEVRISRQHLRMAQVVTVLTRFHGPCFLSGISCVHMDVP